MLARSRLLAAFLACACVFLAAPESTRAGGESPDFEGDRFGPIVPEAATAVRVDRETLRFEVAEDTASAAVTATFVLTNPGPATDLELSFVRVRGHLPTWRDPPGRPYDDDAIRVDGAAVAFRVVGDVELFEPALDAWLAANPPIEATLREISRRDLIASELYPGLEQLVAAAGGRCGDRCSDLGYWYHAVHGYGRRDGRDAWIVQQEREDHIVHAARVAVPGTTEPISRGWSTAGAQSWRGRRLEWLRFHLDFAAGQTRTVTVRYTHRADANFRGRAEPTHTYEYLLSPVRGWADFGPLEVAVELPERALFASSSGFAGEGDEQRMVRPGLPGGEIHFEVMSLRGLWFGIADPTFYWMVLVGVAALTILAFARACARSRRWLGPGAWRTILHALGSGVLGLVAVLVVVTLVLLYAFPRGALGQGGDFSPAIEILSLALLAGVTGFVVSLVVAYRVARPFGEHDEPDEP